MNTQHEKTTKVQRIAMLKNIVIKNLLKQPNLYVTPQGQLFLKCTSKK